MVTNAVVSLFFVALQLFSHGLSQGVDIGVHELRSVGRSVTRRTLSKWHGDDDLTSQDETVLEFLKDNPWAHFSIRDNGRNTVNFSPRLGRNEEMVLMETSRSPPFAPRLGRIVQFTPRYGHMAVPPQQ